MRKTHDIRVTDRMRKVNVEFRTIKISLKMRIVIIKDVV
jgi:hypothetical protein